MEGNNRHKQTALRELIEEQHVDRQLEYLPKMYSISLELSQQSFCSGKLFLI